MRAVRAAVEMRDALPALGLEGRIGVMTGEVVTGTEERLATGDAVNVAARLEQAAAPGDGAARAADARARAGRGRGRGGRATRAEGQGRAGSRLPARAGPRRAGAAARHAVRRTRARARAPTGGVAARSGRAVLRAGDRGRRRRDRQVTSGSGGCGVRGRDGRARPLPPLRRGDHLLARRRSAETARPHACRRDGGGGDPLAARPERRGDVGGGDRLGLPEDAGRGRVGAAAGGRVRRHPVGRGDLPRPRSSTSRCSPRARRSCCSAWHGPRSPSSGRRGR